MAIYRSAGFTVIEVMLFLAVSGLLTASILVSAGASIASQRYKDAVATLQSDLQQQYEDAVSVVNDRTASVDSCTDNRGRSDCVLLGKLITVTSNGTIDQLQVYGTEPAGAGAASAAHRDEYDVLRSYVPQVVTATSRQSTMEWGTGIARPIRGSGSGVAPLDVGVLVLRSPQSGLVYTFSRDDAATNNLSDMIQPSASVRRTICVMPNGWTVAENMAIVITANAASANAVEVRSNQLLSDEGAEC